MFAEMNELKYRNRLQLDTERSVQKLKKRIKKLEALSAIQGNERNQFIRDLATARNLPSKDVYGVDEATGGLYRTAVGIEE